MPLLSGNCSKQVVPFLVSRTDPERASAQTVRIEGCLESEKLDHRDALLELRPHAGFLLLPEFARVAGSC